MLARPARVGRGQLQENPTGTMGTETHTFAAIVVTFLVASYGAWIASDREALGRQLPLLAALGGVLLLVGIPGIIPPVFGPHSRKSVLGLILLVAAAFLAVGARRARAQFNRAALSRRASSVHDAQALIGSGDGPVDVQLTGAISGDPMLIAPVSGKPCAVYRIEVRRARSGESSELVAMDEGAADRLVIEDRSGRLAIAGAPALLVRGAFPVETLLEGEVDAEAWSAGGRLAGLARTFDPDPPLSGRWRYEIRERAVQDGARAHAVGQLCREAGEIVLRPLGHRLQFGEAAPVERLRSASWKSGLFAAFLALAGVFLLWEG